jgi:cytochrome c biogenesis protein CcdA
MNTRNMYDRVMTIFGGLMVFFYIGLGLFLIFSDLFDNYNKVMRVIFGSTLIFYGIARAFRTYEKVKEHFFSNDDEGNTGYFSRRMESRD